MSIHPRWAVVGFLLLGLLMLALNVAHASSVVCPAPRPGEQTACKGDAIRLCGAAAVAFAALGDCGRIFVCFRLHRRELSPACDAVLKSHGY